MSAALPGAATVSARQRGGQGDSALSRSSPCPRFDTIEELAIVASHQASPPAHEVTHLRS